MGKKKDEESKYVEFEDISVKKETEKAILVEIEGDEYWVPKSQLSEDSEVYERDEGNEGTLIVTRWWATQEGLA